MSMMDFGARDERRDTNYGFETCEEKWGDIHVKDVRPYCNILAGLRNTAR